MSTTLACFLWRKSALTYAHPCTYIVCVTSLHVQQVVTTYLPTSTRYTLSARSTPAVSRYCMKSVEGLPSILPTYLGKQGVLDKNKPKATNPCFVQGGFKYHNLARLK
ncbi:hypothetical protein F5B22DRAFT_586391 [Xylaria bambusicola]|uniref:uncharacterized protein n=1 Tax=Xylaria bambusicola TaxID=326684 RepID=UPI002007A585|nr:uncharacterized protein F5B22DRAFT_586391 [Xylaria bambusicola]KAI0526551.1 hypothetical protein F5B22DRAFT_586391 [Xylaria bambusicola]